MATKKIGLIFGVEGGGQIEGISGKLITKELSELVNNINKSGILRLKFEIDPESKKQIEVISDSISKRISGSSNGAGNAQKNQFSRLVSSLREYYQQVYALTNVGLTNGDQSKEYKEMSRQIAEAEEAFLDYAVAIKLTKEQEEELIQLRESHQSKINILTSRSEDTAQLEKQNQEYSRTINSLKAVNKLKYEQAAVKNNYGEDSEQYKNLTTQIESANAELTKNIKNVNLTAKQQEEYNQILEEAKNKMSILNAKYADQSSAKSKKESYDKLIEKLKTVNDLQTKLTQAEMSKGQESQEYKVTKSQWEAAKEALDEYRKNLILTEEQEKKYNEVSQAAERKFEQLRSKHVDKEQADLDRTARKWAAMSGKIGEYGRRYEDLIKKSPELYKEFENIKQKIFEGYGSSEEERKKILSDFNEWVVKAEKAGILTETFFDKLGKSFWGRLRVILSAAVIGKATQAISQIYKNVVSIDSAMTDLRIVTKRTDEVYQRFGENVAKAARQIGVAVSDLINSTTTFTKLGYSLDESSIFAKLTTIYSNVSGVGVDDATRNITAIIKAYNIGADRLERALDQMLYVANNYAIDPNEIGEAMNSAGSILAATGNSFEEAMGILLAANTTLQNVSKSSTAVRTIAARISASTAELDELGEGGEDILATANLDEKMRAFGVAITDANGNLRSTYDVLNDLSKVWDKLNNTQHAAIAGLLAGTRQQSPFYSIMENWSDAIKAAEGAKTSGSELQQAYEIQIDSISGKLKQLGASFQSFSNKVLDSDLVKGVVSAFTLIIDSLNFINKLSGGLAISITTIFITIGGIASTIAAIKNALKSAKWLDRVEAFKKGFKNVASGFKALIQVGGEWIKVLFRQKSAADAAAASQEALASVSAPGWIALATAAIVITAKVIKSIDTWEDKINNLKAEVENVKKDIEQFQSEIDTLESLQKQLKEAFGNKQKLADIYDSLNGKIRVSTGLINGEEGAYKEANRQLSIQLDYYRQLREERLKENIAKNTKIYTSNKIKAGSGAFEWLQKDLQFELVSEILRLEDIIRSGKILEDEKSKTLINIAMPWEHITKSLEKGIITYDKAADTFIENVKNIYGVSQEAWSSFFDTQISSALEIFGETINSYDGFAGSNFLEEAITLGVRRALLSPEELYEFIKQFKGFDSQLKWYYDIYSSKVAEGNEMYINATQNYLQGHIEAFANQFPFLTDRLNMFYASIIKNVRPETYTAPVLKSFTDLLDEIGGKYDILGKAIKDMSQYGYISSDVISDLITKYGELNKYLTFTKEGYKLSEGALDDYINTLLKDAEEQVKTVKSTEEYNIAVENLARIQAVVATIKLSDELEKQKKALEGQKETLEKQKNVLKGAQDDLSKNKDKLDEQLSAYKELIDIRKKLLQTMVDEIDYQKELAQRQKSVAALETKLAIARLDTSASGKARVRELEEELKKSKEDLEDFTLKHAVDVITNNLDEEYAQYELFIQGESAKITSVINDLATAISDLDISINSLSDTISNLVLDVEPETTPSYDREKTPVFSKKTKLVTRHSGGFVSDNIGLKENEVFAKLLKGEYVSTPAQMKNFINKTLPGITSSASSNNSFNAPLVSITCDSITKEAMPSLKIIVDNAVNEVRKILDSGMSRVGRKKPISTLI